MIGRDGYIEELATAAITSSGLLRRDLPDARVVKAYGTPYGPFSDEAGTPASAAQIHAALVGAIR